MLGSLSTSITIDIWVVNEVTYADQKQDALDQTSASLGRKLIKDYEVLGSCDQGYQSPELFIIAQFCDGSPVSCPHRQSVDISRLVQNSLNSGDETVITTVARGSSIYLVTHSVGTTTLELTANPLFNTILETGSSETEVTDLDVRLFTSITATAPGTSLDTILEASVLLTTDFRIPYTEAIVVVDAVFADGSRMNLRPEHGLVLTSLDENVLEVINNTQVLFVVLYSHCCCCCCCLHYSILGSHNWTWA